MKRVIYVDDERCDLHMQSADHYEAPARTIGIRKALERIPELKRVQGREATDEEIMYVHTKALIDKVKKISLQYGKGRLGSDINLNKHSYLSARVAVGSCLQAVDSVMTGQADRAFCNVRPPGHHARQDKASGFCVFNNVAIATRYLQAHYNVKKVAIIDFDVHHGDGTEAIFKNDSDVLYISLHQSPFYPGTGIKSDAVNNTYNVPLNVGLTREDYRRHFDHALEHVHAFKPEFIFISCGFDAHTDDPLAGMNLREYDFHYFTAAICRLADLYCEQRLISVLEGGYNLDAIADSAYFHVITLMK